MKKEKKAKQYTKMQIIGGDVFPVTKGLRVQMRFRVEQLWGRRKGSCLITVYDCEQNDPRIQTEDSHTMLSNELMDD